MAMYSIYASFRHPDTGREVATIELAMEELDTYAEATAEILSIQVDKNQVSIVKYLKDYFYANNNYLPLVVIMKRFI